MCNPFERGGDVSPDDIRAEGRAKLAALGMTRDELDLWESVAGVAGRMLDLPILHPMEREETATDFHRIQLRLLARPGLRAQGWPLA
jgi:hypothetical protein